MINYVKIIGIVLIISAIASIPILWKKWRDAEDRVDQVSKYALAKSKAATYYKNALGQEVIKKEAIVLDRKAFNELRQDFADLTQQFVGVKKNLRNVEQITHLTASVRDTLVMVNRDTLVNNQQAVAFSWYDDWNHAEGLVFKDTTLLDLETEVPITMIVLWERRKILGLKIGKKQFSAQATSPNTKATISGLENIEIQKR